MPTPSSNPVHVLIASDAWGTRHILTICQSLPREQFHRHFAIGLGSLHNTLTHVVGAMRFWTDRLAERPVRRSLIARSTHPNPNADARDRTPDELLTLLDDAERDLLAVAAAACLDTPSQREGEGGGRIGSVGATNAGAPRTSTIPRGLHSTLSLDWPAGPPHPPGSIKTYTFTRAAVLAHVTTHGYHHRAQCLNMLRQLGAPVPGVTDGYPELSAVDWQAEVESPAVVRGG
ncbi:MAG: DinB family protein [Phycisphaerales bacterium]